MAVQQVEHHFAGLSRIAGKSLAEHERELLGIGGTVDEEVQYGIREWVVHDGVELVAFQPDGGFMPHFTKDVSIRVGFSRLDGIRAKSCVPPRWLHPDASHRCPFP